MKSFTILILAVIATMALTPVSQATVLDFGGNINYNTDVVRFDFHLNQDATNVRVWTDSFDSGANFDPITALWTGSGNLISQNDDNPSVNPATQTYFDSGFTLPTLAAGDYIFTVARFANFARGTLLSDGFNNDGTTPVLIATGGYYHVNFDGVDSVTTHSVPEPGTLLLLGSGLAGLGLFRRKVKKVAA